MLKVDFMSGKPDRVCHVLMPNIVLNDQISVTLSDSEVPFILVFNNEEITEVSKTERNFKTVV